MKADIWTKLLSCLAVAFQKSEVYLFMRDSSASLLLVSSGERVGSQPGQKVFPAVSCSGEAETRTPQAGSPFLVLAHS